MPLLSVREAAMCWHCSECFPCAGPSILTATLRNRNPYLSHSTDLEIEGRKLSHPRSPTRMCGNVRKTITLS